MMLFRKEARHKHINLCCTLGLISELLLSLRTTILIGVTIFQEGRFCALVSVKALIEEITEINPH